MNYFKVHCLIPAGHPEIRGNVRSPSGRFLQSDRVVSYVFLFDPSDECDEVEAYVKARSTQETLELALPTTIKIGLCSFFPCRQPELPVIGQWEESQKKAAWT